MADFSLTPEQREMRDLAHEFAEREIRPVAAEFDRREEIPWEVLEQANKIGLLSYGLPEPYGGGGVPGGLVGITNFVVTEELAWGCPAIATTIGSSIYAAGPIMAFGTEEQRQRFIPLFCDPDTVRLGAVCITEPGGGSDVAAMRTTFRREGDEYVLDGTKCFITNGGIADVHIVFAVARPGAGWSAMAPFIVEKGNPGLKMGRVEEKLGVRASHTAEVILENCRIPVGNRLGPEPKISDGGESEDGDESEGGSEREGEGESEGRGERKGEGESGKPVGGAGGRAGKGLNPLYLLQYSRMTFAAASVGLARAAYEYALDYASERESFGKPIIEHQSVGEKLADMATQIDAARLLLWRAGWMVENGRPLSRAEGSMAKCYAADVAVSVTSDALQVLGGHGYMRDHPVEKWYRDARVYPIWEGTSEIQREVISRSLARSRRKPAPHG